MYNNLTTAVTQNVQLNVTPELKQSLFILQISAEELADFLQMKAVDNPLLDIVWPSLRFGRSNLTGVDPKDRLLNNISLPEDTIESMLLSQLRLRNISKSAYATASFLAGNISETGYLEVTVGLVAETLGRSEEEVKEALAYLQALEPAGIAARDLRECLLLQIERDAKRDPWAETIVQNHLQELAGGKWKQLAEKLKLSIETIRTTLDYIRSLNPRPGMAYGEQTPNYWLPDAVILKNQGEYELFMTDAYLPKVAYNREYRTYLSGNMTSDGLQYLRNQSQDAEQLLKGLEQRKTTLRRVIENIIKEQKAFLDHGVSYLKPMKLKTIADHLSLHASTISRAVQNKCIQTPQGWYELKFFFPSGVSTTEGEDASAESIKSEIKHLVQQEDKKHPLSDQQITDLLVKKGIQLSRRTVMKYREEMKILSSRLRS
ncbi:RNA polymerase factor sigma-54 [Paenibacillus alginolyticus]|uniref:RNA polymerase factor sigma-54 n=1 Tax=Paenibacillus alginolyticus TaxID=59839 RepID=A0ABT4G7B8_9BACL|nr:RNA polymerase factor sigma-54 [Paenibacillus alginolyticus]MCY9692028.1 RNA polymerase factor sigma-54 [Paenibacillus alginolyticus]MEC0144218.1 RNA polymerase factor sigma-54 [Paenibacillus alginolyticus]